MIYLFLGMVLCLTGIFAVFGIMAFILAIPAALVEWLVKRFDRSGLCPYCSFPMAVPEDEPGNDCPRCKHRVLLIGTLLTRS